MLARRPAPRRVHRRALHSGPGRSNRQSFPDARSANPRSPVRSSLVCPDTPPAIYGKLCHGPSCRTCSRRRVGSDASLEVSFPFSVRWPRCAVRGCRAFGRSRSGVSSPASDARVHGPSPAKRRPCGFTLLGCDAVVLECGPTAACGERGSQFPPSEGCRTIHTQADKVTGRPRKRVRRIRGCRARERPVTSSNTASPIRRLIAGSCTVAFPGAVYRYLGTKPSRPGRIKGPSLVKIRRRSWGSFSLRSHASGLRQVSNASFISRCADAPALGLGLANWL
jgi:hypothetical protein